jgi:prepilin-type N-terminal cleavage/methylation domain-containing protein
MKTSFNKAAKHGFTLVELLVVIVIIAILATLGFTVGAGALHKARKVTALSSATNVANAVEQFYSEYHVLPDPTETAEDDNEPAFKTDSAGDGVTLLDILAGFEDEQNERKIRFLSVKEAEKGNRGGIVYNDDGNAVEGLFDPWGEPFYIVLDYNYDGRLEFRPSSAYTYDAKLNNKRVAVYCLGTDTPSDAKRKDLVKTW